MTATIIQELHDLKTRVLLQPGLQRNWPGVIECAHDHRIPSTTCSKRMTNIIFSPFSCYAGFFSSLDCESQVGRLRHASACLKRCVAGHGPDHPLLRTIYDAQRNVGHSSLVRVAWNHLVTDINKLKDSMGGDDLGDTDADTVIVVVPDNGPHDMARLHEELSFLSLVPTIVEASDSSGTRLRVRGMPSVCDLVSHNPPVSSKCSSTEAMPSTHRRSVVAVSMEYLLVSLHYGYWCNACDYKLAMPPPPLQRDAFLQAPPPEWVALRAMCPPCSPHALQALDTLRSLLPGEECSPPPGKRLRCPSAGESLQMLRKLAQLVQPSGNLPILVDPCESTSDKTRESTTTSMELVASLLQQGSTSEKDNSNHMHPTNCLIPSHMDGEAPAQDATAPSLLSDHHGRIVKQSSSAEWSLPQVMASVLRSFMDNAVEEGFDASLSTDEKQVIRVVSKYASAINRCFHATPPLVLKGTEESQTPQPLEMVWVAIGKELGGVSGDEALSRFGSIMIRPRHHPTPTSAVDAGSSSQQPGAIAPSTRTSAAATTTPPPAGSTATAADVSEQEVTAKNDAASVVGFDPHQSEKAEATRFRAALPRITEALRRHSEALDEALLCVQECLLAKLKESIEH